MKEYRSQTFIVPERGKLEIKWVSEEDVKPVSNGKMRYIIAIGLVHILFGIYLYLYFQ